MNKEVKGNTNNVYYIAYNLEDEIFHYGKLDIGGVCTTGQPELESFKTKISFTARLDELTGITNYYDKQEKLYENELNNNDIPLN